MFRATLSVSGIHLATPATCLPIRQLGFLSHVCWLISSCAYFIRFCGFAPDRIQKGVEAAEKRLCKPVQVRTLALALLSNFINVPNNAGLQIRGSVKTSSVLAFFSQPQSSPTTLQESPTCTVSSRVRRSRRRLCARHPECNDTRHVCRLRCDLRAQHSARAENVQVSQQFLVRCWCCCRCQVKGEGWRMMCSEKAYQQIRWVGAQGLGFSDLGFGLVTVRARVRVLAKQPYLLALARVRVGGTRSLFRQLLEVHEMLEH